MLTFLVFISFLYSENTAIYSLLPANQRAGIEEYKRAVGATVDGNQNSSLNNHNHRLLANPCFRQLAVKLYQEISRNRQVANNKNIQSPPPAGFRPGFVWDIAIRLANNDPNLAMALIGVCGHDDGEYIMSTTEGLQCPSSTNTFYTPMSLGAGADISSSLRNQIIRTQGNDGDASFIPNKYYHVMGAASTSCLMLQRGVPAVVAQTAVVATANGYRSGRLCRQFDLYLGKDETTLRVLERIASHYVGDTNDQLRSIARAVGVDLEEVVGLLVPFGNHSPEVIRNRARNLHSYVDAQNILLGNDTIFRECNSNLRISPTLSGYLKNRNFMKPEACGKLSAARCQAARHRLETWEVDRQWTEAQHLAGFEFARSHCRATYNDDNSLETSACQAAGSLGNSEAESPNSVAQ